VGDLSVGEGVFAAHKVSDPNSIIHIVEDKQPGERHIGNAFFSIDDRGRSRCDVRSFNHRRPDGNSFLDPNTAEKVFPIFAKQ